MSTEIVKYETENGAVELSPSIVRQYLAPIDKSSGKSLVTDAEVLMFLKLCQYQKLNPFLREVYLIKYGTSPATMVTGKETFLKRAMKNPKYKGHKTTITDDGKVATTEVYVEGYIVPITVSVDYEEYVGMKDEYVWDAAQRKNVPTGKKVPNGMWATKPKTMLKKVSLVQALREAFPDDFGGLYSQEEISHIETEKLPTAPVETPSEVQKEEPIETVTPEVVAASEDKSFTPYVKGGENIKTKETPVETKVDPKAETVQPEPTEKSIKANSLKESSAKLRDEYLVSIANLKTAENCRYLLSTMAAKAGLFTDQDRKVLNAGFEAKRAEILAAEKAPEAPAKEPEILAEGDKVKVMMNGKVVLEGTIEKFGIVGGKRTVKLKEHATPVFADLCTKQ